MNNNDLDILLYKMRSAMLILLGASGTLLLSAIAELDLSKPAEIILPGWFLPWLLILLASTPPGIQLLAGKSWREMASQQRINTAFGFLGAAWGSMLAVGIRSIDISTPDMMPSAIFGTLLIGLMGLILLGFYIRRRSSINRRLKDLFE
jgi:hypothetical protein